MNINKRLDRMKQWTSERMGGEIKTAQTDEFKMLETEMQLRHEGTAAPDIVLSLADANSNTRHGAHAEDDDDLCEIPKQSQGGRRQGEAAPGRPDGCHDGHTWRRL